MKPAHLNNTQIKAARCSTIYQTVMIDLINLGIIKEEDLKKVSASVPQKFVASEDPVVTEEEDDEE